MLTGWISFLLGGEKWSLWYGALASAFLMLMGTAVYACLDSDGPGAGPILMLMVFFLGFSIMLIISTVDVWMWAGTAGYGVPIKAAIVVLSWIVVGLLWTWLFWATDPNYPDRLVPGRIIFAMQSLLVYGSNLWFLSRIRGARLVDHAT